MKRVVYGEKDLESKLFKAVKQMGCFALKFQSYYQVKFPDRFIFCPNGVACFAEIKTTGKKPDTAQMARIEDLRKMGFTVFIIDDLKTLNDAITHIRQLT